MEACQRKYRRGTKDLPKDPGYRAVGEYPPDCRLPKRSAVVVLKLHYSSEEI